MLLCSGKLLQADFRSQLREAHQRCADEAVIVAVVRKVNNLWQRRWFRDLPRRYSKEIYFDVLEKVSEGRLEQFLPVDARPPS